MGQKKKSRQPASNQRRPHNHHLPACQPASASAVTNRAPHKQASKPYPFVVLDGNFDEKTNTAVITYKVAESGIFLDFFNM